MALGLSRRKYIAYLAIVSSVILAGGALLRPEKKRAPQVAASEAELRRLQHAARRRSLQEISSFVSGVASRAALHVASVGASESSGLVWDSGGRVVAPRSRSPFPASATVLLPGGRAVSAPVAAASPDVPVVAIQADVTATAAAPVQPGATLETGMWVVAVARAPDGTVRFLPGIYGGLTRGQCAGRSRDELQTNLPLAVSMNGGGLFDVEGRLVAMLVECGGRVRALPPAEVEQMLGEASGARARFLERYGLLLSPLEERARRHFRVQQGVLVSGTVPGPAAEVGISPGDVITALDGAAVETPAGAYQLEPPRERGALELSLVRKGRRITRQVKETVRARGSAPGPSLGLAIEPQPRGFPVAEVQPGSAAAAAGLQAGDRLLEVNGRIPSGAAETRRLLSAAPSRPLFVVVARGDRRLGVFLQ